MLCLRPLAGAMRRSRRKMVSWPPLLAPRSPPAALRPACPLASTRGACMAQWCSSMCLRLALSRTTQEARRRRRRKAQINVPRRHQLQLLRFQSIRRATSLPSHSMKHAPPLPMALGARSTSWRWPWARRGQSLPHATQWPRLVLSRLIRACMSPTF